MFPCVPQGGTAAPMALHASKGPFSFAKENGPFGTPRERRSLAVSGLKNLCASGMGVPAWQHCCARTGEPANLTRAPRSRARLIPAANHRRLVAKPRTPHLIPQAVQRFKPQTGNVNFLWEGLREGYLFFKKRYPSLIRAAPQALLFPPRPTGAA